MRTIRISEPDIVKEDIKLVLETLKSGWVSSAGKYIPLFERNFAEYCRRDHAIATSSGTGALHLAMLALGVKEGDEVIIPNLTFASTASVVKYIKAKPVLVDIDPETWNIDHKKIEANITARTKAIIVVHLFGQPANLSLILKIAGKNGLKVVEDCAEAHGAEYKGKKIGSFGDISCFSFYGNKIITTGEGGMCLTDDDRLLKTITLLKEYGMSREKKYWHEMIGYNYRMTNMQAALGVSQLKRLDDYVCERRRKAELYKQLIRRAGISFPNEIPGSKHCYWVFPILLDKDIDRDAVMALLAKKSVETRPFFYPISDMPPYKSNKALEVSRSISARGLMLPCHTHLKDKEVAYICRNLCSIIADAKLAAHERKRYKN